MASSKKKSRVTQRDIAEIAQVSQSTVSRVLAGDEKVDKTTTLRVRQAIQDSNYRPHAAARSLRKKHSGLIGLVLKRNAGSLHEDPFFANLSSEIMDVLFGTPYHLCMEVARETSHNAIYDDLLRTRRVDGLILVEPEAKDDRIRRLQEDRFPFVLIGNPLATEGDAPWSVDNDNQLAARMAAEHLFDGGFSRVGMLAGPDDVAFSEDRIRGYCDAVGAHGCEPMVWHAGFGLHAARDRAIEILSSPDCPEALVVLDDFMAMGVVLAARVLGKSVPEDLGIASFNDSSMCHLIDGGLTSMNLNIRTIVNVACQRLLDVMEDRPATGGRRVIVPSHLVVRGSSVRSTKRPAVFA